MDTSSKKLHYLPLQRSFEVRIRRALQAAWGATVSAPLSGPSPPAEPPVLLRRLSADSVSDSADSESDSADSESDSADSASEDAGTAASPLRFVAGSGRLAVGGAARVRPSDSASDSADSAAEDAEMAASPLHFIAGSGRLAVGGAARVRPPVRVRVDAAVYRGHPRLYSVLGRGLKVRVPAVAPRLWVKTPRSALMSAAVRDFVAAGILRAGTPRRCYRLVPVPKSDGSARLIYDLSSLTPHMPRRPCSLPSVERALALSADGFNFGIKIDLRDGFYHIPLAECTQPEFGVSYDGVTYVFARLPMGLSIAPSEMQHFSCATVKLVENKFTGVRGIAYLDDYLFVARRREELYGVADFLSHAGIVINREKSVLAPVSQITYLGVDVHLDRASASVQTGVIQSVRDALMRCSPLLSVLWRQRLAGFVNFLRPCLKLPLEVNAAILDGDVEACASIVPFIRTGVERSFTDICNWRCAHEKHVFVDATPQQIGIVSPGLISVSAALPVELPIYLAEYVAALVAVLVMNFDSEPYVLYTDNAGVMYNLDKGRCPRPWLPYFLEIFSRRMFSVRYIASNCNPADALSRAAWR